MVAIKRFPKSRQYVVCDGVMEQYASFAEDGTFCGSAGISVHHVSRRFCSLAEAEQAKAAYLEFKSKWG